MIAVVRRPDTYEKLKILGDDARYDLACACNTGKDQHRRRSEEGKWIYPVTLPNGGTASLFKTLISNTCTNDCMYCPLRSNMDIRRCALSPEEMAKVFMDYLNKGKVFGLFLSSAVAASADTATEKLNATAAILRKKHGFRGYIHLKVMAGASNAAIEETLSLASAVSINIETAGEKNLAKLSKKKNYITDIIEPLKYISKLTAPGAKYSRVKQSTQFIVGAAGENDEQIIKYTWALYDRLKLRRVYFNAYQKNLGDESLLAEQSDRENKADIFTREHRLYQVDFLFRKYGFTESDIIFDNKGDLSLMDDPKLLWAKRHPELFPVNINSASYWNLLKVPGLGPVTAKRIVKRRKQQRIACLKEIGKPTAILRKAQEYIVF